MMSMMLGVWPLAEPTRQSERRAGAWERSLQVARTVTTHGMEPSFTAVPAAEQSSAPIVRSQAFSDMVALGVTTRELL